MKLTDEKAIKALKKVGIEELEQMVDDYPEDEVDGRSDWDIIANEAGWLLDSFRDDSHVNWEDLQDARECIRRTENGTVMPVDANTFKPIYKPWEVKGAQALIDEYNKLSRFVTSLKRKGLYCPYC